MKRKLLIPAIILCAALGSLSTSAQAQQPDSLQITQRTHPIDEVVVTGSRAKSDARLLPMTISVVDRTKIEHDNRPSLLPTLTEQVPGLFVTSRGVMGYGVSTGAAGGMSIRGIGGSPTTGVMVLIDGHPQYMGLMGHPIADAYLSPLAERVEVVRGPASVLYGSNAMGGVMNIITRKMNEDGVRTDLRAGFGSYNTLESSLTNRIRKGRFTSTITGNYDRSDGHRDNMGFEQYGGSARLGVSIAKEWSLDGSVNLTHFNASNPGMLSAPIIDNDSRITRGAASLALSNEFDNSEGALSLFYNWGRHKIDDGYSLGESPLDYRFHSRDVMAGVSWYQTTALFDGNRTTVGLDYQHFGGKAENHFLDGSSPSLIADKKMNNVAIYVDLHQSITRWLALDTGVRWDHNSQAGQEWIPQGGISILLPRDMQLKAVVAKGFRFPTIREMYMFPPQNPDLKPERVWNYELSLRQSINRFSYGVSIYYINGEDMIRTLPIDGRPKNVNTGRVENYGIEGELSWRITDHLGVAANYSYLNMKYPVVAAPEHKFYGSVSYSHGRWDLSTGAQLVRGLVTLADPITKENFLLWNANASFKAGERVSIYVRGENLLGQSYEINAGYPMPKATFSGGIKLTL